jgi:hypothetical protein
MATPSDADIARKTPEQQAALDSQLTRMYADERLDALEPAPAPPSMADEVSAPPSGDGLGSVELPPGELGGEPTPADEPPQRRSARGRDGS